MGESARYILEKNIICGNALSLHKVDANQQDTDEPIIFSQWSFATGPMIKREDYTFEELLTGGEKNTSNKEEEQLSLGTGEADEGTLIKVYSPIHYRS